MGVFYFFHCVTFAGRLPCFSDSERCVSPHRRINHEMPAVGQEIRPCGVRFPPKPDIAAYVCFRPIADISTPRHAPRQGGRQLSRKSRVALAAILVALPGGCQSAEEAGEGVHSYVSTDQELALIVGKGRYRFGPQLLADHDKVLEGEEKFVATDQGCYHLDFIVLAKPTQRETSCGSFIVRLVEDSTLQQNAKRAGQSPPFQTYEATCRPSAKFCPGQKWNGPTVRYYATTEGELLAFELYPTDSNRTVFVRTSPTALKL